MRQAGPSEADGVGRSAPCPPAPSSASPPDSKPPKREAVRLALDGFAQAVACEGCPPLADLAERYEAAGGRFLVCPICFTARHLGDDGLVANAALGGTVPMWEWIGDELVTTFSY
ncbi:hypothetical protein MUY14_16195 [Amycolatopsis sp. FBCC-B4732]|uniref:hypothetical protein n=1 Tax=Amycolatopsis sp. FBCC-B4732 TaxID=3079339 RepID=UPI001FF35E88|nr:hypothetical protein [Amycolatopsis sp. FBCC-B4732]UOX92093.1 hypothetical protein MUY14_16195 [Amycolatopsis sp. FBCC-B4732]